MTVKLVTNRSIDPITAQTFKEPLLEIIDEEDDVDPAELEVMEGLRN